VYCEELAYEPPRPDKRESDEYDAHSLHVLIRSVQINEFIGCTRIVRARPQDPSYPLPFEKSCAATLDRSIVDPAKLPRETIGEISRLCRNRPVSKAQRRRKVCSRPGRKLWDADATALPYIPAGLYIGTIELARVNGIDTLFCLTEERLANHLRKLGVNVRGIGGAVELHGMRIPSMMSASAIIKNFNFSFVPCTARSPPRSRRSADRRIGSVAILTLATGSQHLQTCGQTQRPDIRSVSHLAAQILYSRTTVESARPHLPRGAVRGIRSIGTG
jgi:N-acyl amino acid synthase of PEP-CTERM/exosortase system